MKIYKNDGTVVMVNGEVNKDAKDLYDITYPIEKGIGAIVKKITGKHRDHRGNKARFCAHHRKAYHTNPYATTRDKHGRPNQSSRGRESKSCHKGCLR